MTFALFASLALLLQSEAPKVVYDNTKTTLDNNFPLLPEWMNESAEAGDEVQLAGTERKVVQLRLIFNHRGKKPGTMDAVIRFREYDEKFQGPGKIFYESKVTQVNTLIGLHDLVFEIPNVVVPDHFVWTIQVSNRKGSEGELGPAYFNPPTVGTSGDHLWQRGGDEWTPYSWGADPYANFACVIKAVGK